MKVTRNVFDISRRAIVALAAVAMAATGVMIKDAGADDAKPMLMFVQLADRMAIDNSAMTLRLVDVAQQTLFFADRPERVAGHIKMDAFLEEWTAKAGADNFGADPPNATLSVYEPGKPDNTLAVVEISNPTVDGKDLVYSYKLIDGTLPATGEATSLFIDWIGVGGGVGPGYHGVGVGARGVGVL